MKSNRAIRILSIILSLLIVIGVLAINRETVFADTDATTGLVYTISGGNATVTDFTAPSGFGGALVIPATLGGASVTTIGNDAFFDNPSLISVAVPSSVTNIGWGAFKYCGNLTSITVDLSNAGYKSVDGFLYSKDGTVLYCCPGGKTGTIAIPSGVTTIAEEAFAYCRSLTGVTIPNTVTSIGSYAFFGCSGVTSIAIPSSVTNINGASFEYCMSLTAIIVDSANTAYKSVDGILYSKDGTELVCCPTAKSGNLTIPSGVTSIGSDAFWTCESITGITIPSGVTEIGSRAFYDCENMTSINIPAGMTSIGDSTFMWCSSLTSISIPSSVTSISRHMFYGCSALTNITIPSGVTSIGEAPFYFCSSLKNAYFIGNAPTMGSNVFYRCADNFTVRYLSSSTGFTNPWNGYPTATYSTGVAYRTHVQDVGWQAYVSNGASSGTSGESKRLEAIQIKLEGIVGGIEYRTHVQDIGWQGWVADDALSGTSAQSKRLEAIQIRLTGEAANIYDVYYRVHAQNTGWMDWAKNGESSGTAGYSYRLEAIEIKLVLKGDPAPGSTTRPYIDYNDVEKVSYKTHVQDIGWQAYVSNGAVSGTSAQSKRLEGIQIKLENIAGGIEYSTHIQDIGWQGFVADDAMSGTSGQSKRLEAIKIRLTGAAADAYDVYYCVHAQNTGWLDWAKNGESSGTAGFGYRLEAIKVVLVPKGGPAPGATARAFVQG